MSFLFFIYNRRSCFPEINFRKFLFNFIFAPRWLRSTMDSIRVS